MSTQKAYQQKEVGDCKFILNEAAEKPTAGAGEVVIKNFGAGVNPIDWKATGGAFAEGRSFPVTCGVDGAGVVDSVGKGVTGYAAGDKVFYMTGLGGFGAYAQFSTCSATSVWKLPAGWNLTEASTFSCAGLTAAVALYAKLKIQTGDWVFVNGGSGGLGAMAVQLAAFSGAKVIATCSGRNADFVKGLGASEVIDYTKEDIVARTKEITGGAGVRSLFDTVSTETSKLFGAVGYNGSIVAILPCAVDGAAAFNLFLQSITVHQFLIMSHLSYANAEVQTALVPVLAAIKAGKFKVPIQKKFTLDEVQAAVDNNKEGRTQGKTVVIIDESLA